jgi:hypothetical protein
VNPSFAASFPKKDRIFEIIHPLFGGWWFVEFTVFVYSHVGSI